MKNNLMKKLHAFQKHEAKEIKEEAHLMKELHPKHHKKHDHHHSKAMHHMQKALDHMSHAQALAHERSGMEKSLHKRGIKTHHPKHKTHAEAEAHERSGEMHHLKHKKHHAKSSVKSKMSKVMHEFKEGTLHSGSKKGPRVTNPKQAIAIAYSESRKRKK